MSEVPAETLDTLVRNCCLAADRVAIGFEGTPAAKTRAVVKEALLFLLGNGLITVNDPSTWPEWLALDPPYRPVFSQ